MTKQKEDYPKWCEQRNEKLLKLLSSEELPDLSRFIDDAIWKEDEDENMETPDRKGKGRTDKDQ